MPYLTLPSLQLHALFFVHLLPERFAELLLFRWLFFSPAAVAPREIVQKSMLNAEAKAISFLASGFRPKLESALRHTQHRSQNPLQAAIHNSGNWGMRSNV
jgi:hypothetical protein